jgi:hypothetical protein
VSGKVYYQGKPVPGGTLTFVPEGKGEARTAIIREDGSYQIDKVQVGSAKISVVSSAVPPASLPRSRVPSMMDKKPPKDAPPGMEAILATSPGKYVKLPEHFGDPDKSGLKYTVKSGSQDYDIQLK